MRISTSKKVLPLAAAMFLVSSFGSQAKVTKPSGGSVSGDLVISKVFYNNMMNDAGKAFILANYLELYNNSADTLNVSGIYIGIADNTSSTSNAAPYAWTVANMNEVHKDSIALKQLFQIPTDKTYTMNPGQSIVICNSATNHTTVASKAPDLSSADFEVKSQHKSYADNHNDQVPALNLIYTSSANNTFLQWMSPGPFGVVLLAADTKIDACPTGYLRDQTEGTMFMFVPAFKTLDAVDIVEHTVKTEPSASQKRIGDSYDAGWTATASPGGNNGEAVVRNTAFVNGAGRLMLYDTNNSSIDFEVTTDLSIRSYGSEMKGLSDHAIVIPESGYLAIKTEKPFFCPDGVMFSYVSASAKSTDLRYNELPGDSLLLMAGDWIAIGAPGTYSLRQSEAQAALRSRSTSQSWCDEDHKELTGSQKSRTIYKFSNAVGKVGFQRVPQSSEGGYNVADFSDGDRLYISLTPTIVSNLATSFGVSDLDFIPWHGSTPSGIATGIVNIQSPKVAGAIYNLQGAKLRRLQRGFNIVNGKKVIVRY